MHRSNCVFIDRVSVTPRRPRVQLEARRARMPTGLARPIRIAIVSVSSALGGVCRDAGVLFFLQPSLRHHLQRQGFKRSENALVGTGGGSLCGISLRTSHPPRIPHRHFFAP